MAEPTPRWHCSKDALPADGQKVVFIRTTGEDCHGIFDSRQNFPWRYLSGEAYYVMPMFWRPEDSSSASS